MPTEDRRKGKLLPSPVVPPNTVCFTINIPNAVQYRAAFLGQINVLGQALTWDHPTDGTDCVDCEQAAQLWRNAIYNAVWSDECGVDPMSCADVADCIENDASARAAVSNVIQQQANPGTNAPPAQRLPDSTWAADLIQSDDCNLDELWAQVQKFVDYVVAAGLDFLEIIETYSNAIEAAQFIEMAPVIGTVVDEAQIDQALELFDWAIDVIKEVYEAADTAPNRQAMACALFCAHRSDCEMSLEDAFNTINARIGGVFTPASLTNMSDLIEVAITLATNPAFPLDVWVAFVLSVARVAGYLGVQGLDKTLNLILKVAADSPDHTWVDLCTDCPPEPTDCFEFSIDEQGWIGVIGGWAQYTPEIGWGQNGAQPYVQLFYAIDTQQVTTVRVHFTRSWAGATANPDYDKFYIIVQGGAGSTSPVVQVGAGAMPLLTGQSVDVNTASGLYWTGTITISILAGGNTWPQSGGNPAPAQYVDQICLNPSV